MRGVPKCRTALRWVRWVAFACAVGWLHLPARADIVFHTVVMSGTQAPGTPAGALFRTFYNAAITPDGKTAFTADLILDGGGVTVLSNTGVWTETLGPLSLVAREGDQPPGLPTGAKFLSVGIPVLGPDGQVAFLSTLSGTGVTTLTDSTLWTQRRGAALTLMAREGDPLPGEPAGSTISSFSRQPVIRPGGGITIVEGSGQTVFSTDGSTLSRIARAGTQAAGLPPGVNYGSFNNGVLTSDDQGKVVFNGVLLHDGVQIDGTNDDAIWHGDATNLRLVAQQGLQAPGAQAGTVFRDFGTPRVNANGRIAFRANLSTGGSGIWSDNGGTLTPVAMAGQQAPGTPDGVTFNTLRDEVIDANGHTAFVSSLKLDTGVTTQNDTGIWSEGSGKLSLVAREGSQAPGTPAGAVFKVLDPPMINSSGRVAFRASLLTGTGGITADNDLGVWAEDPNGVLSLVVREGDPFQVAPGDVRTVSFVDFRTDQGLNNFPGVAYTDNYSLAFSLLFTDGSVGAFTATLVPEPNAAMGAMLVGSLALISRRRKRAGYGERNEHAESGVR